MAPTRTIAELVRRQTRRGDDVFIGHSEHSRIVLRFGEIRTDDAGRPVEVWLLEIEQTEHHPAHEAAPPAHRRANAGPGHQRSSGNGP